MIWLGCAGPPAAFDEGALDRPDARYTVDVAQLALAAARRGDEAAYDRLHPELIVVIHRDPADPFTRGMVDWRRVPGEGPDASGTTEGLRVAEALWTGAARFGREADRALAIEVLEGWLRHARVDNGVWMIANYFDFRTRAFARNSFLVDYDPDFLAEVARATGRADLAHAAARSYAVIDGARSPAGLLYDLLQPELLTLSGVACFSPNDEVQLHNAAAVAEQALRGRPGLAADILDFAWAQREDLRARYLGRDGSPLPGAATPATWAVLCRLATGLDRAMQAEWACGQLPETADDPWTRSELALARAR